MVESDGGSAGAEKGDERARLAMEVFAHAVRHYVGAYLVVLGGADAIVFTGGIGENSARMRAAICNNLDWFGIMVDPALNDHAEGETRFDAMGSRVQLWAMPTNEELIVARQAKRWLEDRGSKIEDREWKRDDRQKTPPSFRSSILDLPSSTLPRSSILHSRSSAP